VKAASYDILKKDVLGYRIWLEAVEDLRKASVRIEELALHSPGKYIVFNQQTSRVVTALGGWRRRLRTQISAGCSSKIFRQTKQTFS